MYNYIIETQATLICIVIITISLILVAYLIGGLMSALTDVQATVSKLQTDVSTLINFAPPAPTGGASDAELQALNVQLQQIDQAVVAATPAAPAPQA